MAGPASYRIQKVFQTTGRVGEWSLEAWETPQDESKSGFSENVEDQYEDFQ